MLDNHESFHHIDQVKSIGKKEQATVLFVTNRSSKRRAKQMLIKFGDMGVNGHFSRRFHEQEGRMSE